MDVNCPPWTPDSWINKTAAQQPKYPDKEALDTVLNRLGRAPALVTIDEIKQLRRELALACEGKAFVLQGGDCAESFAEFSENTVLDTLRVLLQMAVVLMFSRRVPVVKIGRLAGQFAKPRSQPEEEVDGVRLPSYKGDIINEMSFDADARRPDPERMWRAYVQAVSTLNLVRAWSRDGLADLRAIHNLTLNFTRRPELTERYLQIARDIERAIEFMAACGISSEQLAFQETRIYTSHEALLLPYERSLFRQTEQGQWFNASSHFCWIGDRTRQLDGAHVEMLRGIENPIGLKVGPSLESAELLQLIERLNPENIPGKLMLITRFGNDRIGNALPPLVEAVKNSGAKVLWSCDPMHGNTFVSSQGLKTRRLESIAGEVEQFFNVHHAAGTYPGGVHLELTGKHVTECLGGGLGGDEQLLRDRYHTHCDPRLNNDQSLELAFLLAKMNSD